MSWGPFDLTGKAAIVTGGAMGIGYGIAARMREAGADVAIADIDEAAAGRAIERLESVSGGGRTIALRCDVSDAASAKAAIADTVAAFGALDILVNNAGVYEFAPLEAITLEHYHRQFTINVLGLLLTTQAALPLFPSTGGSVINIGSLITALTPPASAVYTGTKGAVDAITGVLSSELAPRGIRVNSLNPGVVETEGTHTAGIIGSDMEKDARTKTPLGRTGQPDDIAKVAVFLASDDSGWVTGELIRAGGGLH
jgi:3-oxoacyl-[acyl-carrier protein] reductase